MEKAFSNGLMGVFIMVALIKARSLAMVLIFGLVVNAIRENSKMMNATVPVFCIIQTAKLSMVYGKMERNKAHAITYGQTEPNTMYFTMTENKEVRVNLNRLNVH